MGTIQVKLSHKIVTATIVKQNKLTVWVRLPDGNVIKRHKRKHLITKEGEK